MKKNNLIIKYKIPLVSLILFLFIGVAMWVIKDIRYLYLFAGIGVAELVTRIIVIKNPKYRQVFRLSMQFILGSMFIFWLSLFFGINFQFTEIFFDTSAGIVTGALIQMLVARVIV